jgi:hypothetical protein
MQHEVAAQKATGPSLACNGDAAEVKIVMVPSGVTLV